jgi:hypothetical protein
MLESVRQQQQMQGMDPTAQMVGLVGKDNDKGKGSDQDSANC